MLVISVAGSHGSGKSTFAKKIAKALKLRYVSIGSLFRDWAKEKNLSIKDFSLFAEEHPEVDKELDNRIISEAEEGEDVVIDSQLSAWMTKNISNIKIYLTAPISVRIKRIARRDNISYEEAEQETITRENSEKKRYKELYNIDILDLSIYDIVINTELWSIESTLQILKKAIKEYQKNSKLI